MKTIKDECTGEIIVKKSRFIATMRPVANQKQAEGFVAEMKKKYWDARHNCSAYILPASDGATPYVHSSDDGEPSGTAGKPMLAVLQGHKLYGIAVVVTRYFGGVLLGTGGLVRAYQDAVAAAVEAADIIEEVEMRTLLVTVDYTQIGRLQSYVAGKAGIFSREASYEDKVIFPVLVPLEREKEIRDELIEVTNGKAQIRDGGISVQEIETEV